MHVCKNCELWDPSSNNECREIHSDFIKDREGANFCAHFNFVDSDAAPAHSNEAADAKSKLEAMFKNLK